MELRKPLLSICLPTYNRATLLEICLQAMVVQIREQSDQVELLIGDNASTDETPQTIEAMQKFCQIQYIRNASNLGAIGNILNLILNHAQGEYVLIIGDDDLIRPGAIKKILGLLSQYDSLDTFYVNFQVATGNLRCPKSAWGGYDGPYSSIMNPEVENRMLDRWISILRPCNGMGSNVYSHIVRRQIWLDFWKTRPSERQFQSVYSTYPHTVMLIESVSLRPGFYIGEPLITAFYGTATWVGEQSRIYLTFLPELLEIARKHGMERLQYRECKKWVSDGMLWALNDALSKNDKTLTRSLWSAFQKHKGNTQSIRLVFKAINQLREQKKAIINWLENERTAWNESKKAIDEKLNNVLAEFHELNGKYQTLIHENQSLDREYQVLNFNHKELNSNHQLLAANHEKLSSEFLALNDKFQKLNAESNSMRKEYASYQKKYWFRIFVGIHNTIRFVKNACGFLLSKQCQFEIDGRLTVGNQIQIQGWLLRDDNVATKIRAKICGLKKLNTLYAEATTNTDLKIQIPEGDAKKGFFSIRTPFEKGWKIISLQYKYGGDWKTFARCRIFNWHKIESKLEQKFLNQNRILTQLIETVG